MWGRGTAPWASQSGTGISEPPQRLWAFPRGVRDLCRQVPASGALRRPRKALCSQPVLGAGPLSRAGQGCFPGHLLLHQELGCHPGLGRPRILCRQPSRALIHSPIFLLGTLGTSCPLWASAHTQEGQDGACSSLLWLLPTRGMQEQRGY